MNPHTGIDDNNRKDRTKAIAAAIPMAGILFAAAFLSGLSLIGNYQPTIAQNMTAEGNATTATTSPTTAGAGNTTGTACAPQTGGGNATTTAGGAAEGNTTTLGTTIVGGNATTAGGAGGNQTTTGSPTQLIEQACMAALNNDTQGVLMNLNAALNALSANMIATADDAEDDDGDDGEEGEGGEEGEEEG